MNMKNKMILISAILLIAGTADAQRMPPSGSSDRPREEIGSGPDQGPDGPVSEERREEVRKKIEAVRIWRLTEELKLDSPTAGKLSGLLSSLDQKRRTVQREQMDTMRALRQALQSESPDRNRLKSLLDTLEKNHGEMQDLRNSELKGLKEILTIEQQARYLLFQQEFQREIRGMIGGARQGRDMREGQGQRRGGMMPPGPAYNRN